MKKIYRKQYINKLISLKDKNIIKVLTGIRRAGKSTILKAICGIHFPTKGKVLVNEMHKY